jgi:hypothetical protein
MFERLFHRRQTAPAAPEVAAFMAPRTAWPGSGLHVCPGCRTSFVCPVEWDLLAGGDEVWILLRCGQCEDWRDVTVSAEVAERCSQDFERARSHITATVQQLECQRMAGEVTTFVTALDRDLIDAADFGPRRA